MKFSDRIYNNDPAWCPGCGNFPILKVFDQVVDELGLDRKKLVLVSGIGQAAKLPHYTRANVFNGLHGRAVPAATGIKLANHQLEVVITSGDGDIYGEGGNHFIHAIRRNVGIKVFVHNNQVYALTKGQASPTSDPGFRTKVQSHGVVSDRFHPLAVAVAEDAAFVARSFAGDQAHLKAMMIEAIRCQNGFALLDILQPCVTFNRVNTYKWYRDRVRPIDDSHDPYDRARAMELALKWDPEIPIGVIYRSRRESFESHLPLLAERTLVEQCG
ncbi:MAG: 2-oxoacid ferredoxin oxidoreductase [Phycisphaerae bacterium]|nr:2-oxoacid ferredoxin oxidoreductase [Phycisphaerae bacterium]